MQIFTLTGMSCAACSAHVEKAVTAVPGVKSVAVSLLTHSMGVEFEAPATPEAIVAAVEKAGYGASPQAAPGADGPAAPSAAQAAAKALGGYVNTRLVLTNLGIDLAALR